MYQARCQWESSLYPAMSMSHSRQEWSVNWMRDEEMERVRWLHAHPTRSPRTDGSSEGVKLDFIGLLSVPWARISIHNQVYKPKIRGRWMEVNYIWWTKPCTFFLARVYWASPTSRNDWWSACVQAEENSCKQCFVEASGYPPIPSCLFSISMYVFFLFLSRYWIELSLRWLFHIWYLHPFPSLSFGRGIVVTERTEPISLAAPLRPPFASVSSSLGVITTLEQLCHQLAPTLFRLCRQLYSTLCQDALAAYRFFFSPACGFPILGHNAHGRTQTLPPRLDAPFNWYFRSQALFLFIRDVYIRRAYVY